MTDNTFNDYRELLEEHLLDFIPDVDHIINIKEI